MSPEDLLKSIQKLNTQELDHRRSGIATLFSLSTDERSSAVERVRCLLEIIRIQPLIAGRHFVASEADPSVANSMAEANELLRASKVAAMAQLEAMSTAAELSIEVRHAALRGLKTAAARSVRL